MTAPREIGSLAATPGHAVNSFHKVCVRPYLPFTSRIVARKS